MMTQKERFTRAAFGQEVDMLPIQCDLSASGLQQFLKHKGISNVSDLELLPYFDNHVLYGYMNGATLQMKTKNFPDADHITDEWGCDWSTTQDLMYLNNPLSDWDALEQFKVPDPNAPGFLDYTQKLVEQYSQERIVTSYHFCCLFERSYILRGIENLFMDFIDEPEMVEVLLDKITDFHVALAKRYVSMGVNCGRIVDDYGSQRGLMISPAMWRQFIKPRLARIYAVYRDAGLPVIQHSCGKVVDIVPDLIEIGLNVLNPVQPNVMDLDALANDFGKDLTFFGGICNQQVLPYGTPEEIDANVAHITSILGKHGRFVISPSNSIGADVPLENITAYYNAAQKYRHI